VVTAADVVRIASAEVGYREGPNNWNRYAPEVGHANNQAWCGTFTDWVLKKAGQTGEPTSIWTPSGLQAYRRLGRAIDRNGPAQAGDLVYFDWQGGTGTSGVDHVGIVTGVRQDGQVETIEGNTSPSNAGSQSNGGGVYRRVRPRSVIAGFGRPAYSGQSTPTPPADPNAAAAFRRYAAAINIRDLTKAGTLKFPQTGSAVLALQRSLNLAARKGLVEDGIFGAATTAAVKDLQRLFKLEADGIVGPKTREALIFLLARIERGEA
jgi:peptidoglycan hydrolase-like protein with peptidoglycan-binding domain